MTSPGTFAIPRGTPFLDEDGAFRARACRGVPPGVPPVTKSAA